MGAVGMIWVLLGSRGCCCVCPHAVGFCVYHWGSMGAVVVAWVLLGLCGCRWDDTGAVGGPMGAVVFVCMPLGSVCAVGVPWMPLG